MSALAPALKDIGPALLAEPTLKSDNAAVVITISPVPPGVIVMLPLVPVVNDRPSVKVGMSGAAPSKVIVPVAVPPPVRFWMLVNAMGETPASVNVPLSGVVIFQIPLSLGAMSVIFASGSPMMLVMPEMPVASSPVPWPGPAPIDVPVPLMVRSPFEAIEIGRAHV